MFIVFGYIQKEKKRIGTKRITIFQRLSFSNSKYYMYTIHQFIYHINSDLILSLTQIVQKSDIQTVA